MKYSNNNIFYKVGLPIFILFLFMNAPFFPIKSDFLSGLCAGTGLSFMLLGILDSRGKLTLLKNKKKTLLQTFSK